MRVFKTRWVHRWASKEGLTDTSFLAAVEEVRRGLVDADLGGHVFKKRVALPGRGKSGGARVLLAFKRGRDRVFFVYGFAKKARATISGSELRALRRLAEDLLDYDETRINMALAAEELMEVIGDDK